MTLDQIEKARDGLGREILSLIASGGDLNSHRGLVAKYLLRRHQAELLRDGQIVRDGDVSVVTESLGATPIRRTNCAQEAQ